MFSFPIDDHRYIAMIRIILLVFGGVLIKIYHYLFV